MPDILDVIIENDSMLDNEDTKDLFDWAECNYLELKEPITNEQIEKLQEIKEEWDIIPSLLSEARKHKEWKRTLTSTSEWRGYPFDQCSSQTNKIGLFRTVNYIASMVETLEKQSKALAAQQARTNSDIFREKNDEIKEYKSQIRELKKSFTPEQTNKLFKKYYIHILEEDGNIKGHQITCNSSSEIKCECGWAWNLSSDDE